MAVGMSLLLQDVVNETIHVVGSSIAPVTHEHHLLVGRWCHFLQQDVEHPTAVVGRIEQRRRAFYLEETGIKIADVLLQELRVDASQQVAVGHDDAVKAVLPQP